MNELELTKFFLSLLVVAFIAFGVLVGLFTGMNDTLLPGFGEGANIVLVSFAFFILGAYFYGYAAPFLGLFYGLVKWKPFIEQPLQESFKAVPVVLALFIGIHFGKIISQDIREPGVLEKQWMKISAMAASVIIVSGAIMFAAPFFNESLNIQDCGTSKSLFSGNAMDKINFEGDAAMACIGKNLLADCKKASEAIDTNNAGKINLTVEGLSWDKCMVKLEFGGAEQIQDDGQKKFAGTYLECPLDLELLKAKSATSPAKKPGTFAASIYSYMNENAFEVDSTCTCSMREVPLNDGGILNNLY